MGGARPCKPGATAADDTRGSVPCEWCQAMVNEKNECSIDGTFSFKNFYSKSDSNILCAEMTKMLAPQSNLINSMGTFFFFLISFSIFAYRSSSHCCFFHFSLFCFLFFRLSLSLFGNISATQRSSSEKGQFKK